MNTFYIFKSEKKGDKSPDYNLVMSIEDKLVNIGAGWVKDTKSGKKMISCKLNIAKDDREGFEITKTKPKVSNDFENF